MAVMKRMLCLWLPDWPSQRPMAHDVVADQETLQQLAVWCEQFSPLVGVSEFSGGGQEPAGDASLLLDVTGVRSWFGGEENLVRQAVAALHQRGYCVQAALADTIGAAWAVAHFGWSAPVETSAGEDKARERFSVAVNASPGAVKFRMIASGEHLPALRPLPVAALRLEESALELLQQLGIQRIHTLLSLPRASLSARFGQGVLRRLDQAAGTVEEVLVTQRPPPEFSARRSLEYPTALGQVLEVAAQQVLAQVTQDLVAQNRAALQFDVHFDCVLPSGCTTVRFRVDLFRPVTDVEHLWHLVRLQWEKTKLPGPVREIRVRIPWVVARTQQQQELFAGSDGTQERALARFVDRLRSRLGCAGVLQPLLQPDVQPECACQFVPAAVHRSLPAVHYRDEVPVMREPLMAGDRPLRIWDVPRPVQVLAGSPAGPPVRFRDQHGWHEVRHFWGPERIETGWWRGHTVRRDYYRVECATGQRFWLFRQLTDGQWFLHGVFA
jgi:protein ImuB